MIRCGLQESRHALGARRPSMRAARMECTSGREARCVRRCTGDRRRADLREARPHAGSSRGVPACTGESERRSPSRRVPCSTTRPAYITTTSSAFSAMTPKSWLTSRSAMPVSRWSSRKQLEDLRLHGHIESRGRLVCDQQIGAERQRHRDHHALPHPSGKLVRVCIDALLRARDADAPQQLDCTRTCCALRHLLVGAYRLVDLPTHLVHRMQRRQRILKHHRDASPPDGTKRMLGERHEIDSVEQHLARDRRVLRAREPEHRERRDRLSGAGLAHEAERPTAVDTERHTIDRSHRRPRASRTRPRRSRSSSSGTSVPNARIEDGVQDVGHEDRQDDEDRAEQDDALDCR